MVAKGHKINDVPLILKVCNVIFLYSGKTDDRLFLGAQDFF
jgi:hypothetical protein